MSLVTSCGEGLQPTPLRHSDMDLSFPIPVIVKVALSTG
jgi:hypothetical protein